MTQWARDWLAVRPVAVETVENYRIQLRVHLLPEFGRAHLEQIDQPAIRRFIARLTGRGLAGATIRSLVTLLGTLLRDAIHIGYLAQDPTAGIRIPHDPPQTRAVVEVEQIRLLAERMPTTRLSTLVITAAFTGLRPGESAALQQANVGHDDPALLGLPYIYVHPTPRQPARTWRPPVAGTRQEPSLRPAHLPAAVPARPAHRPARQPARHRHDFAIRRRARPTAGPTGLQHLVAGRLRRRRTAPLETGQCGLRFHALRHNHRAWMDEDGIAEEFNQLAWATADAIDAGHHQDCSPRGSNHYWTPYSNAGRPAPHRPSRGRPTPR